MARRVERGQRASAQTLPSDHRPPFSQPPRPGTPFSVPQPNIDTLPQWGKHLQGSQLPRPGTPFSVPQPVYNTLSQCGKHLTSRNSRDFAPPGLLRPTRHKFRCPKPYEDQRFKKPDAHITEELQKLKSLINASANNRTLDPLRDQTENKKWTVPLPLRVPEGMSNPLTRDTRPSALQPVTRKRVASSFVPIHGKVKKTRAMSTGFEVPMDFGQLGTRVPATSTKHSTGDPSEKFKYHTVPGPSSADSSADRGGQVISPHIQGSLHPSLSSQGDLGSSTSPQDAQQLSQSTQEVLELNKSFQGSIGQSTSAQVSQRLPTCAERKIIQISSSRRSFKSSSPTRHVSNISNSPLKHVGQDPSGQGDLQQDPPDKEGSKPSTKGKLSDFSFFLNGISPTTSPQERLTCLPAAKAGQRAKSSHKDSQRCSSSPPNCPMQPVSSKVSLRPGPVDQGDFRPSSLNQEGFQIPPSLINGLRSSPTVKRVLNVITIPQVSLTPLIPAQEETKVSTSTPAAQGPLQFSEGALESSTHTQDVAETPESTQGNLEPSAHTQTELAPSPSSPEVLRPSQSVRRAVGLSTSTEEGQRHVLKSTLPHKRRIKYSPAVKRDPEHSHSHKRRMEDAPSKQRAFTMSQSDKELFKYPLPAKRALLTCHQDQKSQGCAETLPVSHTSSIFVQCAETIHPSLPHQGTLGQSLAVGEDLKISTYTSEMLGFPKPVQDSLSTTLSDKVTVGQDKSTKGVLATVPSLEMACRCDTSTKDGLGHIPSIQKVLDPILCEHGAMGCDMHTQESVASCTSKEGDSLDSTCAQESIGPPQTSQEATGTSLSPQEDHPSSPTTQDAIDSYPSAQRAVGPSPCPQISPEHLPNTTKVLDSNLSSEEDLEPVLPIKLAMKPDTSIQKVLSPSPAKDSLLGTSSSTQGGLETSLPAHEALRPLTYVHHTLGEATSTQVALVPSPHSEATVKTCIHTQGTLRPSPPEQEPLGSTISEQGALQFSSSTKEYFFSMPSLGGNSSFSPSTKVVPRHPVSRKKRLRVDCSDKGGFRTFSSEEDTFNLPPSASSPAAKKASKATATPHVSPTPSISIPKALECPTIDQGAVESCQSTQGYAGHSVSFQEAQGPSLSPQKALVGSTSAPGLQGISSSLLRSPEHFPHAQGDSLLCKSDFSATQPPLYFKGSKGMCTSKKKHLEVAPLAQTYLKTSTSSKVSKNPSASRILAGEHLPSDLESTGPSTSKQGYLETLPDIQMSLGCSTSASGALCAQGTIEPLPSGQGVQKAFPSLIRYSGYLPHFPGDLDLSSAQGVLGHVSPVQGPLDSSSCSPGFTGPVMSLQRPLDLSTTTQSTPATSPTTQWALESLLYLPSKVGSCQSAQEMLVPVPPRPEALIISPSAVVAPGPLPVAPEPLGFSPSSQETPSYLPHVHGVLDLSQNGSGPPLNVMLPTQWQQGSCSSSEGGVVPLSSVQGAVGQSLSAQPTLELSTSTQGTLRHSLSGPDDMAPSLSSKGTKAPLPSVDVDMKTWLHAQGSPGHLTNVSDFPRHMLSNMDSGGISLPSQGSLTHLSSSQRAEGLSLSAHRAPEQSTLEQGTIPPMKPAEMALMIPSSQGAVKPFQCAQDALEHLLPSVGDWKHSVTDQQTQKHLTSAQEAQETLPSNSKAVESSPDTGGLQSSLSAPRALDPMLYANKLKELSLSAQGSPCLSRSTQEAPECLAPLKPFQSAKEGLRNLTLSQTVLESSPSISGTPGALTLASGHTGLFSFANETQENSQYTEGVVKSSSATGTQASMTISQKSLENSLSGEGIIDSLISSQGPAENLLFTTQALEKPRSTKGRIEKVSSPERPVRPLPALLELSRLSLLNQGPHQHSKSASGPSGLYQSDSGIQRPLESLELAENSTSAPGALQPGPFTLQALDHLQTAEGPRKLSMPEQGVLHPSPSTQGSIQPLVPSPVVVELSKSEYRKLGHLSNVEKDMEISPSDTGSKGTSPSASHSSLATEALVSSSSCQGSQGSLLSTKEVVKDSLSVPDVQKPYPFTTQDLEALVTTQGPLHIYTPSKQNLHSLPSTLGDLPLKRTVEMSSLAQGILEPLISNQGEGTKYQSEKDNLGQSVLIQGTIGPLPPRGAIGLPKSESRTQENLPSEQGSSSYTQGTEKPLLCSPVSVKPSSVPRAQKPPQTTSRTLKIVRCKQGPPKHSMSVQKTVGSLPSTPGSPEQSSSFQKKLGHSSQIVASEDTSPSVQGTTGPLPCPSRPTGHSLYDQGSWESSVVSRDLAHLLSTKLLISAPPTLSLSPYTRQSLQPSSSLKILEKSESAQCTHKHLSSVSSSLGMSSCEPRTTGTLPHVPKLVVHSLTTQASPAPPPSLQKSVATSLYPQATREMKASAHISLLPSPSTQVPAEASHYAEATLGRPVAAQGIEEPLLSSSGILDYKECDKQELVIFPSSQVFLGLSLPEEETLGSLSSAQGVLGTSLSTQESLKLSTSKQEPIGTVSSVSKSLKHPAPSQRALKFSPSFQHTLQCSSCSPETTGPVRSSQENPGTFLSSPGYAEHYPSAPCVQVHPLSTPAALRPSQGPKKNNTAAKGTLPVQRSLTSIQRNREHSSYSTGGLGQYTHTQSTLGHLPCVWEDVESSQSASGSIESLISSHPGEYMGLSELPQKTASSFLSDQGSMGPCLSANESMKVTKSKQVTLESSPSAQGTGGHSLSAQETVGMLPPSPPQSGRHTFSTQGGAETLQPVQGNLAPLQSAQGPLKLSISAQAMIHNLGSAEGALLHSAPSPAVSETNEYSPSTRGTSGTSRYARLHLDLSASLRLTPSSSQSEQGTVGPCLSEEGTLKVTKSKETTLGSSASVQDNGGHTLSGQATVAKSMSAKQTVGTVPPIPGPLGSTQNTQVLPEPLPSDQRPLEISLSLQGSLGSSSSQEAFRDSCSAQGSLKLSTSKQGTVQTVSSAQKTLQPPTSCQAAMRVSPSAQHAAQRSTSSPRPTGPFLPSQKSQEFFCTSPSDLGHCPPVLGAQEHIVPAPGVLGALLSSQKPKEISRAAEETMPVQSSLFSNQRNLEPSAYSTGILGQPKESQSTLGYLPLMREDIASSQSASTTLKNLPTSPPEPGRHSSATQVGAETFPSGQGYLAPLQSTQELLKLSVSGQAKMNTSQCSKGSHNLLGLSSSEQGAQASSESSHGAVGPCLSTQGIVRLSTSTQTSTQHTTSAQRLSSPSLHTQVTGTQSTSTKCTVEYSPSTPGCQGYTYPAQKKTGTLKSDQGSLRISATAQGFVEPLPSPEGTLGYSTSAPDAQETSTATPGHVVSDDSPLELLISAQLIPLFSSLRLLDPSLSIEGTLDFSKPTEDTLGPSTSCQGLNESLNSPQRVQQTDPSASDSSGSMHSSTDPMLISLSGQGTLGSVSPALGPLTMSLSVQVNPGPLLSVQEAGGPCLSLQGNLEGCTCTHGEPGISNASPGVLKISSSSTVSLGSSPSDQMNLGVSQPVTLSLSAQGVLGTLTSAQEAMDLSSDTLGTTETLGYVQHDLGLRPPCLGTQRPSQFHQSKLPVLSTTQGPSETSLLFKEPPGPCLEKEALGYSPSDPEDLGLAESAQGILETLPCTQNTLEIPPVTQEIIDPLSPAQDSLRFPTPSSLSSEAEEPLPCVKRSSPQEDISQPISTEEGSKHALIVQEGEKPSISAKREPTALVHFLCGFIPPPVPKGSATSFPVNQGKFRHISQAGDVRSPLSYQGKDKAYEFGYPLCDPSVLGGHKYTHFVRSNLKRIPLQKGRCSSFLSPEGAIRPSQSDQCGLRLSSSHQRDIGYASPVSDSLRMFQAERVGLAKAPSKKLGLRDSFYDKRGFTNSNQEWVRPSSSAVGSLQLMPSALPSLPNGTCKATHHKRVAWALLSLPIAFSFLFFFFFFF